MLVMMMEKPVGAKNDGGTQSGHGATDVMSPASQAAGRSLKASKIRGSTSAVLPNSRGCVLPAELRAPTYPTIQVHDRALPHCHNGSSQRLGLQFAPRGLCQTTELPRDRADQPRLQRYEQLR